MQIVLQRRSGDEQTVHGLKFTHDLGKFALFVFDSVRFVDNQVSPMEFLERCLLFDYLRRAE